MALAGRTVLFLVTEDWYFLSHRLPIARAVRDAGGTVVVATRTGDAAQRVRDEGFRLCPLNIDRSTLNPLHDLGTLRALTRLYSEVRPDIVHHVAIKPTLYGSIAAARAGVPAVVNAVTGLGFLFISQGPVAAVLRPLLKRAYRALFNRPNSRLILQNEDDQQFFANDVGVALERTVIIRGSGVDTSVFRPTPEPSGMPVAVCVSRMLKDKGVGELVEAARILQDRGTPIRVRLVGPTDDNPASFPEATLRRWQDEGVVDVAGATNDVAGAYAQAHIAVLPSYREGLPKSLLEGAACGRPIVATDVPGCREICRDGETGFLVPVRTSAPLADALERLAGDPDLRRRMGQAARAAVEEHFAEEIIVRDTLALYEEMLAQRPRALHIQSVSL